MTLSAMRKECRELYTLESYRWYEYDSAGKVKIIGDPEAHSMANLISCMICAEEYGGSIKWHRDRWAEIVARRVMEAAAQWD